MKCWNHEVNFAKFWITILKSNSGRESKLCHKTSLRFFQGFSGFFKALWGFSRFFKSFQDFLRHFKSFQGISGFFKALWGSRKKIVPLKLSIFEFFLCYFFQDAYWVLKELLKTSPKQYLSARSWIFAISLLDQILAYDVT